MRIDSLQFRRALTNGLIAGAVIIFLVLIGVPGGASDADGLPAWFVWGTLLLTAAASGYTAARARSIVERRHQTLIISALRGLVVGVIAAVLTVLLMISLNAAQLWELRQTPENATLPNGLRSNVTRVQDVLANVTPRTTALMAGLPLDAIKTPNGEPRANPIGGFILMSGLLVVAGLVGGSLSQFARYLADRRERAEQASTEQRERLWVRWIPLVVTLLLFLLIVFNGVAPTAGGGIADVYRSLIGSSSQLIGLLASFFLVGSGLIAIQMASDEPDHSTFIRRFAILAVVTLILFGVGFVAPSRPVSDLLFSPRPSDLVQVASPQGLQVISRTYPPVDADTLYMYRRLLITAIGVLFLVGNFFSARRDTPLGKLLATHILLSTLVVVPLFLDRYQQSVLLLVGINVLLGLGLNIVVGYAGLLNLGYVAFFAIGAYAYAFLSSNQDIRAAGTIIGLKFSGNDLATQNIATSVFFALIISPIVITIGLRWWRSRAAMMAAVRSLPGQANPKRPVWLGYVLVIASILVTLIVIALLRGTSLYASFAEFPVFVVGILIGMLAAAFAGVLLGIPVLRLRGDYLAIVTLGFGEIIRLVLNNLRTITGGPQGIVNIPHATVGNVEIGSNEGLLYLVIAGCIAVAFMSLRLKTSRLGRAWGALKSDEDIAQAMGINVTGAKVLAFAIGEMFAGIGGVLFAARQANIFPDNFTLTVSINVLSLVIIGGMGSVPGVIVGALVLIGVPESLRVFEAYRVMVFGALLVVMMVLRPAGLLPESPQPLERRARALAAKEARSS